MRTLSLIAILASVASVILLDGCATQGDLVKIPITMPNGEKGTIGAYNQRVPDYWLDRDKLKANFLVKGDILPKQLAAVSEAERACRIYTKTVRPSNLVAVASSGGIYLLAGATGLYWGTAAFTGATQVYRNQSAEYGGWASGTGGAANGLITLGGQTYTFENCTREVLALFPGYEVKILQKSPY